jgi:hypothetical protein
MPLLQRKRLGCSRALTSGERHASRCKVILIGSDFDQLANSSPVSL